ncbi:MAG: cytochrome P450 [Pseudomonadota bacterium]
MIVEPSEWAPRQASGPILFVLALTGCILGRVGYWLSCKALSAPSTALWVLRRWRRIAAILRLGNAHFPLLAADIDDVLTRSTQFTLADRNAELMLGGPFLLSLDWKHRHEQERQWLARAFVPGGAPNPLLERKARETAETAVAQMTAGRTDLAEAYAEEVAYKTVLAYLGIELPENTTLRQGQHDLRRMASYIFVPPPVCHPHWMATHRAAAYWTQHLTAEIAGEEVPADSPAVDATILEHLKAQGPFGGLSSARYEDWIRANLHGLLVTGVGTIARSFCHAIYELGRQGRLAEFQDLAAGAKGAARRKQVLGYLLEALRFRPMLWMLPREVPHPTVLAPGTAHACNVPAGAFVGVPLIAAMFDENLVTDPDIFDPTRDPKVYRMFGFGPHRCLGEQLAELVLLELSVALSTRFRIREAGRNFPAIRYDATAADRLYVTLEPLA